MRLPKEIGLFFALNLILWPALAQDRVQMPGASAVEVYKSVGEVDLRAWIFQPPDHRSEARAPAIVFFFGGGWRSGTPEQFAPHCAYLAARGMVAIAVDYRVFQRHGVRAKACVADAKSAVRWIRGQAGRLGVDPDRIVAAGGSAGGHLAAATATLPGHDDPGDDLSLSPVPNALALFNPVVVVAEVAGKPQLPGGSLKLLEERMGAPLESMSPYHHLGEGVGPTILFHGTEDTTVPFATVKLYDERMDALGNTCVLVAYEGEGHGFFNFRRKQNGPFIDTVHRLDAFLVGLGYLEPPPPTRVY